MTLASVSQAVTQQMLDLRTLLPHVDVSRMMAQHPDLIFKLEPGKVAQQLHLLRQALANITCGQVSHANRGVVWYLIQGSSGLVLQSMPACEMLPISASVGP